MPKSVPLKIVAALAVLAALGFLFMRSVRSTRSAPYTISRSDLRGWTVAIEAAAAPAAPILVLRASPALAAELSRQVFQRNMESQSSPETPAIPLVLRHEFDLVFAGRVTPDALADAARNAGLESTVLEPRCLAHRRISEPGVTSQLHFVLFDAPAFTRFREQIGALLGETTARVNFDSGALSPVLFIGATDSAFHRWLPLRADPRTDCVAPITAS